MRECAPYIYFTLSRIDGGGYLVEQADLELIDERVPVVGRDVQKDTLVARAQKTILARHSETQSTDVITDPPSPGR